MGDKVYKRIDKIVADEIHTTTTDIDVGNIATLTVNDLTINASSITIQGSKTPTNATSNGITGDICWDASYLYVCHSTNTWVRTSTSSW